MQCISQEIADIFIIKPKVNGDSRDYFIGNFRQDKFEAVVGYKVNFVQDNESRSAKSVFNESYTFN